MKCPHCDRENTYSGNTCSHCGTRNHDNNNTPEGFWSQLHTVKPGKDCVKPKRAFFS